MTKNTLKLTNEKTAELETQIAESPSELGKKDDSRASGQGRPHATFKKDDELETLSSDDRTRIRRVWEQMKYRYKCGDKNWWKTK